MPEKDIAYCGETIFNLNTCGVILYHVTIKIEKDIASDWLEWMKKHHIPKVLNTGFFLSHRLCKMLSDEEDGITFSVQYLLENKEQLNQYLEQSAPGLQLEHTNRYEGKFVAYRTLHEVLEVSNPGQSL